MRSVQDLRVGFLDFFKQKQHLILPSSPLVPPQDPTLMFTNAGMVQFKDVFLGQTEAPAPCAATIQKCLRISGKHNDFDEVGFTNRHLTFFEMLGNFSFGAYFKKEAIVFAWEFLTQVCKLPPDRLHVSVHDSDDESAHIWQKEIGIQEVFKFDEDNFWQMAEIGPCGPCSEIYVDLGPEQGPVGGENVVGGSGPRFVEIWNLVFMSYERLSDGRTADLPRPCVDTGAGLERLASVIQGVSTIYETNEFVTILKTIEEITETKSNPDSEVNYRVVSDHIRSIVFLMQEGIRPSNEGRGYVLRRLVRRALRFAGEISAFPNVLSSLIEPVSNLYTTPYPEVASDITLKRDVLLEEEDRFFEVIRKGSGYLENHLDQLKTQGVSKVPGQIAFVLHDTYGFPIDLTRVVAKQHNMIVDETAFEKELNAQRERSRGNGKDLSMLIQDHIRTQGHAPTPFLGYETLTAKSVVLSTVSVQDDMIAVIFDQTPFYPTGGGQVGDCGILKDVETGQCIPVHSTERVQDVIIHVCGSEAGHLNAGSVCELYVDGSRREVTQIHHTATHLMHAALRRTLGDHVKQQGSFVGPTECRFDFSHHKKITPEELSEIEYWVNGRISEHLEVQAKETSLEEARAEGTLMFFDEKYGDQVRQIRIGDENPVSLELCGGTHANNTKALLECHVLSEQSIAQGIRRIQILAGPALLAHYREQASALKHVSHLLQVSQKEVASTVAKTLDQVKIQSRSLDQCVERLAINWAKQVKEAGDACHVLELQGVTLHKKSIKKLGGALAPKGRGVTFLIYGTEADRRFVLWVGKELQSQDTKTLFLKLCEMTGIQGGGHQLLFQGSLTTDIDSNVVQKALQDSFGK